MTSGAFMPPLLGLQLTTVDLMYKYCGWRAEVVASTKSSITVKVTEQCDLARFTHAMKDLALVRFESVCTVKAVKSG